MEEICLQKTEYEKMENIKTKSLESLEEKVYV